MNIAFVGCGYVSEFYRKTLDLYPDLQLVGAYDCNANTLDTFCQRWQCRKYPDLNALISDPYVELVLNLTNPRNHYEITSKCLDAGKHVYSEKPLAMDSGSARELVILARQKRVHLAAAPCNVLCESAQTVYKALADGLIGQVRLVYANFDDGMIAPHQSPWNWRNDSGIPWPAKDEFEVGCTYEHAGYLLTWLDSFFGPARAVTAFASCQIPNKGIPVATMAPDFSVGCIEYGENIVARVTCSLVAPKDKSMTIIGDKGVLSIADVRNDVCPVYLETAPTRSWQNSLKRRLNGFFHWLTKPGLSNDVSFRKMLPLVGSPRGLISKSKPVDFCRGPAEMVQAIRDKRPSRLSPELALQIVEIIETLQYPERFSNHRILTSTL